MGVFYPFRYLITETDLLVLALYSAFSGFCASWKFSYFSVAVMDGPLQEYFPRRNILYFIQNFKGFLVSEVHPWIPMVQ